MRNFLKVFYPKAQCAVLCRQEAQKDGEKREGGFIVRTTHPPFSPHFSGLLADIAPHIEL